MTNFHVLVGQEAYPVIPVVRRIGPRDIWEALGKGIGDFRAMPSHLVFLGLIYPICGIAIAYITSQQNALPLIFPLVSGFALIGPFAAIGLYEISRRRELGLNVSWAYAFNVVRSPSIPSIVALGLLLLVIFISWLVAAQWLYASLFGPLPPASYVEFLKEVVSTQRGWMLIGFGGFIGFCFAVVTLSISVVAFPLLLDRDAGAAEAVATSVRAVWENPGTMALWGVTVTTFLLIGSLPLFIGLAIVVPILGHATWHLYRKVVARDPAHEHPTEWPRNRAENLTRDRASPNSFLFPERPTRSN
jgi:uncharacterized membrane protein